MPVRMVKDNWKLQLTASSPIVPFAHSPHSIVLYRYIVIAYCLSSHWSLLLTPNIHYFCNLLLLIVSIVLNCFMWVFTELAGVMYDWSCIHIYPLWIAGGTKHYTVFKRVLNAFVLSLFLSEYILPFPA